MKNFAFSAKLKSRHILNASQMSYHFSQFDLENCSCLIKEKFEGQNFWFCSLPEGLYYMMTCTIFFPSQQELMKGSEAAFTFKVVVLCSFVGAYQCLTLTKASCSSEHSDD
jgi:hypothetical protein